LSSIRLVIDKEGHVAQADVLSGHPLFVQPALDAVKQWDFKPYLLNGEPVEVETTANLYFGPPQRLRVSQGVVEGNLLHKVDPLYPEEAKAKHIRGDVILQATISKEGKVTNLTPVKGDPLLAQAAMEAVRQWEYKPYELNGNPVEVETTLVVKFRM
jgi:TonB family protein